MVEQTTFRKPNARSRAESGRTRRLQNNFSQSVASPFSDELTELLVWTDRNSLRPVYVLDNGRPRSWTFSLHVSRHIGSTQPESGTWKDASADRGILDMGRRLCDHDAFVYPPNANGFARGARIGKVASSFRPKKTGRRTSGMI